MALPLPQALKDTQLQAVVKTEAPDVVQEDWLPDQTMSAQNFASKFVDKFAAHLLFIIRGY